MSLKFIKWFVFAGFRSLFFCSLIVPVVLSQTRSFSKILLPPKVTSPESVELDPRGEGPYVTIADGRILKWLGPDFGFMDFATTSSSRFIKNKIKMKSEDEICVLFISLILQ